jgi:hypothetical protein
MHKFKVNLSYHKLEGKQHKYVSYDTTAASVLTFLQRAFFDFFVSEASRMSTTIYIYVQI